MKGRQIATVSYLSQTVATAVSCSSDQVRGTLLNLRWAIFRTTSNASGSSSRNGTSCCDASENQPFSIARQTGLDMHRLPRETRNWWMGPRSSPTDSVKSPAGHNSRSGFVSASTAEDSASSFATFDFLGAIEWEERLKWMTRIRAMSSRRERWIGDEVDYTSRL